MFKWQKSKAYKCTKASSTYRHTDKKVCCNRKHRSSFKLGCHKIAVQTILRLSYCNLNRFQWILGRHSGCLALPTSPHFISESRSWLRAASICSCFVAARGRAMLFKICSLSDSLLALAVTISTSKPFLDWNELKCNKKMKKNVVEVVETLCTKPTKNEQHKDLTTNLNFEWILSSKQFFIQQTRNCWSVLFTSRILKLSWAALRFAWEIWLPAATWQRNPRMESAAAPFQIGHLWWHGLLHHHHQWQLGLTTRCCQRFLRISDGGRQLPITSKSWKIPKPNAFFLWELDEILLFVFEKKSGTLNF